jgi:hypothetical protein
MALRVYANFTRLLLELVHRIIKESCHGLNTYLKLLFVIASKFVVSEVASVYDTDHRVLLRFISTQFEQISETWTIRFKFSYWYIVITVISQQKTAVPVEGFLWSCSWGECNNFW